jgi:DeoR family transcriptional regulator, fructose operon transcriptional repressor
LLLTKRKQRIMDILKSAGSTSVQDLINELSAAPATVRRDLVDLEASGMIYRTRGEVHIIDPDKGVLPYLTRSSFHPQVKLQIAKYAASLVSDNMNLILDSGSTVAVFAQKLTDKKVTIVTNSLDVVYTLANSDVCVISTGGMLQDKHMCFVGPDTLAFLGKIEVDAAFLGVTGFRENAGFTTSSPLQYEVKRAMIASAKKRYALFDSSKFSSSHLYVFATFSDFDAIITNRPAPGSHEESVLNNLIAQGANIILI